jgi:hypothetical protein
MNAGMCCEGEEDRHSPRDDARHGGHRRPGDWSFSKMRENPFAFGAPPRGEFFVLVGLRDGRFERNGVRSVQDDLDAHNARGYCKSATDAPSYCSLQEISSRSCHGSNGDVWTA